MRCVGKRKKVYPSKIEASVLPEFEFEAVSDRDHDPYCDVHYIKTTCLSSGGG